MRLSLENLEKLVVFFEIFMTIDETNEDDV